MQCSATEWMPSYIVEVHGEGGMQLFLPMLAAWGGGGWVGSEICLVRADTTPQ
jgi:hypothetical protein